MRIERNKNSNTNGRWMNMICDFLLYTIICLISLVKALVNKFRAAINFYLEEQVAYSRKAIIFILIDVGNITVCLIMYILI